MDSFIEPPTEFSAFDILDAAVSAPPNPPLAAVDTPRPAISAWQESLAVQNTAVTEEWVKSTAVPRHRR